MARVVIENLSKIFKGPKKELVTAVRDVNLTIEDREFMVLVGPSGCGKSTLLRMIAGLEESSQGTISIDGRIVNDVEPKDRDIAMVFQNYALYPHMTVYENMAFGLKLRKVPKAEIEKRVRETAENLGLTPYLDRLPKALSGGQRQRVAVGRAIVRNPKVFLFDEPLSNLDAKMRVQMRLEISRLHEQISATIVYVTHDQVEAMTMGDRIAVMRDGVIQQVADPMTLYRCPKNLFVAGFIGSPQMNFFQGIISKRGSALWFEESPKDPLAGTKGFSVMVDSSIQAKLESYAGRPVILGIRPENVRGEQGSEGAEQEAESVSATIELVEPTGAESHLYLNTGLHSFVARVSSSFQAQAGVKLRVYFDLTKAHFFDPSNEQSIV